jgi:mRNA interferase YafQ
MRTIERTSTFKRDYKRTKTTPQHKDIDTLLPVIVQLLADDKPLAKKHRDHPLSGIWKTYRECHLKPDLLLIYQKPDPQSLHLIRMGSHSQIFS